MSFMFKPLAYDDPHPINRLPLPSRVLEDLTVGTVAAGARLARELAARCTEKPLVAALDGYASAQFQDLLGAMTQQLGQLGVPTVVYRMEDAYKSAPQLDKMLARSLPGDDPQDPALLFGKLYDGSFGDFFDPDGLELLRRRLWAAPPGQVVLLVGHGSTSVPLAHLVDVCVYLDVTPKTAAIRAREGRLVNLGDRTPRPFKELMRRCYYADFEVILRNRRQLLEDHRLDYYLCADRDARFVLMRGETLEAILGSLVQQPFRAKPVYLEGIWGGEFIRKVRGLPREPKNIAWVFDLIPMEVSILVEADGTLLDFPFSTFLQQRGREMMGDACHRAFGGYFPIRFNYDDTYHSNGNMSIQVHPDASLCVPQYNEKGGQDEAYYVVATAHGAKTYVGFRDGADPEEFLSLIRQSEETGQEVDYRRYVNALDSAPGLQVMLPGGTIHASGRGQLILELGSLTVGSYTYKLYDYNRVDADGSLRPIHSAKGAAALHPRRDAAWVAQHLTMDPVPDGEGPGWQQQLVGQTDLMYYHTKTLTLEPGASATCSNDGQFTVLTLVDGEQIRVESAADPRRCYHQQFLDVVVVPATLESYTVRNTGYQPCVVHKTMLRPGAQSQRQG